MLDLAVLNNIVDKSGAWYSYQGERIGQGRENVRGFLKENRDIFARIDAELRKKLGVQTLSDAEIPSVPADGAEQAAAVVKGRRG
jgi:recombination protein RecA